MTSVQPRTEHIPCPFCGSNTTIHDLGRVGLSIPKLKWIDERIQDGTFQDLISVAQMLYQRMEPTTTSLELTVTRQLDDLQRTAQSKDDKVIDMLRDITEQITGVAKGDVSEMIVSEKLQQAFTQDTFDRTKADKKGTDIIGTIFDDKDEVGKISISVKDTTSWSSKFTEQLEENMRQDGTSFGILVSKKLPKGAKPTGHVLHSNGKTYCIVHHNHVNSIYLVMRLLVIKLRQHQQYISDKEKEIMQLGKVSKALAKWIMSSEYQNILTEMAGIEDSAQGIQQLTEKKVNYELSFAKNVKNEITKIHQRKLNACSFLTNLEELLRGEKAVSEAA